MRASQKEFFNTRPEPEPEPKESDRELEEGLLIQDHAATLFSTEALQPPQGSAPVQPPTPDATIDKFVQNTSKGAVYGKLLGISRNKLKTDVVKLLEGCNLTLEDVKVQYTGPFVLNGMNISVKRSTKNEGVENCSDYKNNI